MKTHSFNFIGGVNWFLVPLLSFLFLLILYFSVGIRSDHYALVTLVNVCYFLSSTSRKFIIGQGIVIVYWIIFDSMKWWPNWSFHSVDILPIYQLEKSFFAIGELTPNEFFLLHSSKATDIITAVFYLCWVPVPLLFSFYLFFKNKNIFLRFWLCFFITNLLGFIIYYSHPAAPPWYLQEHGNVIDVTTTGNAAGLLRFDRYFDVHLFRDLYAKGSNVFAAMPSLHSSYPLIGFYYSMRQPAKWMRVFFFVVMIGIWFSAIYLQHHYVLDVIAGILCGSLGILLIEKIFQGSKNYQLFLRKYETLIR